MIRTNQLHEVTPQLLTFIEECDKLGYKNNNSLEVMNFQRTLDDGGVWFETSVDDKIVGISGVHEFRDGVRALYRGCQLYSRPKGLSINNDASGKMGRLNKLYYILERNGLVDLVNTEEVFGVDQNIWLLNEDRYLEVRGEE